MLNSVLAELYGVEIKALTRVVRRNIDDETLSTACIIGAFNGEPVG